MKKTASSFAALLAWMFAGVVSAQTTTATTTATTTPGVPNTGAGDVLTNIVILALAATVAVAAATYLYATRPNLE